MGTKYSSQSITGYNDTPPPDDGTKVASNVVKWSTHKTKLGDPLKALAEAINTALVDHFDVGPDRKTGNYTTGASDYNRVIEMDNTGLTASLYNEASAGAGYVVTIKNADSGTLTVNVQGGGTIDGSASVTLGGGASQTYMVNSTASEYMAIGGGESSVPGGGTTKMVFVNSAAPDGWTFDATLNDRVLRATSTVGDGGSTGGSWTVSGLTTNTYHRHNVNGTTGSSNNNVAGDGGPSQSWATNVHTHTVNINSNYQGSTSNPVSSNGTWRPNYVDVIVCSKD